MARTEKSKKKTKLLFILIVLTAILSILSTYAWFSTQKDVSITGLNVKVEVAESMQISLNGAEWFQDITISDMNQLLGTSTTEGVHQANATNTNYVPTALHPVSTVGTLDGGKISFSHGIINVTKLESIEACDETTLTTDTNADHAFLVFDLYVRNVSASETNDNLQLNAGSSVTAQQSGVGLAESVRVGFLAYNTNTAALTETDANIRGLAGGASDQLAIWEPNYNSHTPAVVAGDTRIESATSVITTMCVKDGVTEVPDIMALDDDTNLATVVTNQIPQTDTATTEWSDLTTTVGGTKLAIAPNKITKVRIYLWLEGQDPDCVDVASTGQQVNATIRLTKGKTVAGG